MSPSGRLIPSSTSAASDLHCAALAQSVTRFCEVPHVLALPLRRSFPGAGAQLAEYVPGSRFASQAHDVVARVVQESDGAVAAGPGHQVHVVPGHVGSVT